MSAQAMSAPAMSAQAMSTQTAFDHDALHREFNPRDHLSSRAQGDMFGLYAQDEETTTALFYAPLQLAPEQSAKSQAVENEKEQVRESAQAEQGSAPSPSSVPTAKIDLNHMLVSHPGETFYCRVNGDSMSGAGIFDGDILIVDRHATPRHGDVVLAILNNELSCRTLDMHNQVLRAANPEFQELPIEKGSDFDIKGVVISSIRLHRECEG